MMKFKDIRLEVLIDIVKIFIYNDIKEIIFVH